LKDDKINNDDRHRIELWQAEIFCPKCNTSFDLENEIKKIRDGAVECRWLFYGSLHIMGRRWCPQCRFRLIVEVVEWGILDPPWHDSMYDKFDDLSF